MARLIAALAILAGLNAAASAQENKQADTTADAQENKMAPARCTSVQSGFRAQNGIDVYYVEVTSACEKRQRCITNVYVVGSRGGKAGQGTLILDKASPGQEAKKTWTMRTAENGGMAQMSWSCKDI